MNKHRTAVKKAVKFNRKPLITALESRILLDGAAVATGAEALTDVAYQFDSSDAADNTDVKSLAPTQVRAADPTQNNGRREVAFIDTSVSDYQVLVDGISAGVEVQLIDGSQDGLAQLLTWSQQNSGYDAIHLLSHGSSAQINLGSVILSNANLADYAGTLNQIGQALTTDGDFLVYGCNVAQGDAGVEFIGKLAHATRADIAASDDLTGAQNLGGDWELEQVSGELEAKALAAVDYNQVLAPVQVSVFSYPGLNGSGSQPGDENANLASIVQAQIDAGANYTLDTSITSFTDPDLANKLDTSGFFFMTDMESQSPTNTSFFPESARTIFRDWVADGGVIMMTGTAGSKDADFLNLIFDWDLKSVSASSQMYKNDANVAGTPFENAEASYLNEPSATDAINKGTVDNFTAMYGTDTQAAVAVIEYGSGYVIYLGFDFYNAGTQGGQYGNAWVQEMIPLAMEYSAILADSGDVDEDNVFSFPEDAFQSGGTVLPQVKITSLPGNGMLTLASTAVSVNQIVTSDQYTQLTYTPDANFNGKDDFNWQGYDGNKYSADTAYELNVAAINDSPILDTTPSLTLIAIDEDVAAADNDGTMVAAIVADGSISDIDGDTVEAIAVSAVDNSNGTWQYRINSGEWTAFDFSGNNASKALLLDSTDSIRFLADADFNGSVTDGITFHAWDKSQGSAGNYLTVSDNTGGEGALSANTDSATLTVNAVNDAPVATADTDQAVEAGGVANGIAGSNATGNVLNNDTDVDKDDTRIVTAIRTGDETGNGMVGTLGQMLAGQYGTLTLNADGSYRYAVNESNTAVQMLQVGDQLQEQFTYTIADAQGLSDQAVLTLTIEGRNDTPEITASSPSTTLIEAGGNANGLAGIAQSEVILSKTDIDGEASFDTAYLGSQGWVSQDGGLSYSKTGVYGTATLTLASGMVSYVLDDDAANTQSLSPADSVTDSFSVQIIDDQGATALIDAVFNIDGRNDSPFFAAESGDEPQGNDNEEADTLSSTYEITEGPDEAALSLAEGQTVMIGFYVPSTVSSGTWQNAKSFFDSEPGMSTVEYDYTETLDSHDLSADLLFIMQPDNALNNDEIAALSAFLDKGGRIFFVGEHNGYKPTQNDNISAAITALGGNITVLGGSYSDSAHDNTGAIWNLNNSPLMAGLTTFKTAAYAQLQIDSSISKAVVVDDANRIVMADQALSLGRVTVLADQNWLDSSRLTGDNSTFLRNLAIDTIQAIELVEAGGNPNADFIVASGLTETDAGLTDSGSFSLFDHEMSDVVTVSHTVTAVQKDSSGNVVASSLLEPGEAALLTMLTTSPDPVVDGSSTSGTLNWSFDSGSEAFNYLNAGEQLVLTYTLTADDGQGGTATQNLEIVINGTNDAPVAADDIAAAIEAGGIANGTPGSNATGNVLINDSDVDAADTKAVSGVAFGSNSGTLSQALTGAYGNLTLNADGSYSYVVDESNAAVQALKGKSDILAETFSYTMQDAGGLTHNATLMVTITGANDAPVAVADMAMAVEAGGVANATAGSNGMGNVLSNDTDVDSTANGETKTVTALRTGAESSSGTAGTIGQALAGMYGTLTLKADGSYRYQIDDSNAAVQALRISGQTLQDQFTYTVSDAAGLTDQATLTVTIDGRNDTPVVHDTNIDEKWSVGKGYQRDISVLFSDADSSAHGEDLDFVIEGLPAGLSYDAKTGLITGKPAESGKFVVSLTAIDVEGASMNRQYLLEIAAPPQETPATVTSQPATAPQPPAVDSSSVQIELSGLPDGLINQRGSRDSFDNSGYMATRSGESSSSSQASEETALSADQGGSGTETVLLADERASVVRNTTVDGSVTVTASVEVNVSGNGEVVFSDTQQRAFDIIALKVTQIQNRDGIIGIAIADTKAGIGQQYSATMADGTALPAWIEIDPNTGSVNINPPADAKEVAIRIRTIDSDGQVRILEIKLDLEELTTSNTPQNAAVEPLIKLADLGFVPLADQLAAEADAMDGYGERLVAMLATA